jgi:hypothetical protein
LLRRAGGRARRTFSSARPAQLEAPGAMPRSMLLSAPSAALFGRRSVDAVLSLRHEVGAAGRGLQAIARRLERGAAAAADAHARSTELREAEANLQAAASVLQEACPPPLVPSGHAASLNPY